MRLPVPHLIMSRPEYFRVAYEINPWMRISHQPNLKKSARQWQELLKVLTRDAKVKVSLVPPVTSCPDLVFTANAGFISGREILASRFRYAERRKEEPHFRRWFNRQGYRVRNIPQGIFFEGEGDLLCHGGQLFLGYRFRSESKVHRVISAWLHERVLPLELVDKRFYHLDTCFLPLNANTLLYYPGAFDAYARRVIQSFAPNPVAVTEKEAVKFVLNGVVAGKTLVTNEGFSTKTKRMIRSQGFRLIELDLSEFHKSGGSAKCLTLYAPARRCDR
ncbi:MAG: amidinotransferase [Candidatus Omnitrophica bacterium]|nr:amidinotransferase [Candidatus Omnitrophota bacterium]